MRLFIASVVLILATNAIAQTLTGPATATDGDTLRVGPVRVRLHGLDAPKMEQTRQRAGADYACGHAAQAASGGPCERQGLICQIGAVDRYKRLVATCCADGKDVGREMVRQGWALAYQEYSERNVGGGGSPVRTTEHLGGGLSSLGSGGAGTRKPLRRHVVTDQMTRDRPWKARHTGCKRGT